MPPVSAAPSSTLLKNLKKALAFAEVATHVLYSVRAEKEDGWLSEELLTSVSNRLRALIKPMVPPGVTLVGVEPVLDSEPNDVWVRVDLHICGEVSTAMGFSIDTKKKHADTALDNLWFFDIGIGDVEMIYDAERGCEELPDESGSFEAAVLHRFDALLLDRFPRFQE